MLLRHAVCCQASAQSTQKLSASKANDYGIMYSLPATVLKITLEAERTECNPGEFYKYARRYLGTSDAVYTFCPVASARGHSHFRGSDRYRSREISDAKAVNRRQTRFAY